jgi:16S rRNA (cytosine967-C5)-methyltransferase
LSSAPRQMRTSSRTIALELLFAVEFDDAYANLLLPKLLKDSRLDERDSALAQELSFGTLRWQLFYDRVIEECAKRYADEIDLKALIVLRLGSHQLLGMRTPAHAALDESVELAKQFVSRGAAGFVNGVLRRVSERTRDEWLSIVLSGLEKPAERLAVEFSHPIWVVKSLQQSLALDGRESELQDLLLADNIAPLVSLVALPGLARKSDFEDLPVGPASPIGAQLDSGDPNNLVAFREGRVRVQDQGSQLAALALVDARPVGINEEWLDLCAGPGGKAALLAAEALVNEAKLTCNEVAPHRAKLVRQALAVVDDKIIVTVEDGRTYAKNRKETFDRILLDAPCTGLGALRRRPESRWRKRQSDVAELSQLQEELLQSAWDCLKPGGVLAYVTCSPHLAETNAIVDWAKKKLLGFELLDANTVLSGINSNLLLNRKRKTAQLWPHIHQTDAMFIALMTKTSK